ncbi:hydrogenase expression/formation protein HypE, partial [bacterium]|nr:hydrogenase expression/formation protein HypE [bacterium]
TPIESDCACLAGLVREVLDVCDDIHVLRDPTRGGLGTTLNEISSRARVGITIREDAIPVRREVQSVCDILGFDPLYMANEGKVIVVAPVVSTDAILAVLRANPLGADATVIGEVGGDPGVRLRTSVGGLRPVLMLEGVQLPRIC